MPYELCVKLGDDHRHFVIGPFASSWTTWLALSTRIKERFRLPVEVDLALKIQHAGHDYLVDCEEEMVYLKPFLFLAGGSDKCPSITCIVRDGTSFPSAKIPLCIALSTLRRLLHYDARSGPSLATVENDALVLFSSDLVDSEGTRPALQLADEDGSVLEMVDEEHWETVGWPVSVKTFRDGEKNGKWAAATFFLAVKGQPTSSAPIAPSTSIGSTTPLFSPAAAAHESFDEME
ncbi:hypothetical protein JCM6882_004870 [Rhodosporidiobolus microsporus]